MAGPDAFDSELLVLASRRLDFLEQLREEPLEKREMVDALGHSRSTVNRAVAELEEAGLVTEADTGHVTTLTGRLAADLYRQVVRNASDIQGASDVLAPLPATSQIDLDLLSGAEAERIDGPPPYPALERIRDAIRHADRVRAFLPTLANLETLRVCHAQVTQTDTSVALLMRPDLFERLTSQFPDVYSELARCEGYTVCTTEVPEFTGFIIESNGTVTVAVIVYTEDNAIHGILENDTAAAVRWIEALYERARSKATDRTDELSALDVAGDDASGRATDDRAPQRSTLRNHDPATGSQTGATGGSGTEESQRRGTQPHVSQTGRSSVEIEANGFVRLRPDYFEQRAPQRPAICWRTGLDLVEVHAGYAIDREFVRDGERTNLTDHLIKRLRDGVNQAVIGPPGSGKSTVCKSVACRWYENEYGPVFYRESGYGKAFDSRTALKERLREADGQSLVVVEDAVRGEANAVFKLMKAFSGVPDVTFLLDSRKGEWQDPEEFPIDAGLEAYRQETIETFVMPSIDRRECERLVAKFESTISGTIDPPVDALLERIESESDATAAEASPGEILLLLHRLSSYADPLANYESRTPTTLTQDIQQTYESLQEADDELVLDVGVTVNLLNACGVGMYPDLVHALAPAGEHSVIREALSMLEGQIIFRPDRTAGDVTSRYRSIHESWSRMFLKHLLVAESERDARERFGRCVSALLSLSDDPQLRERIDWEFEGEASYVDEIMLAPSEWADDFVRRIFSLGREYPSIAPLFGRSEYTHIDLPDACSAEMPIRCTEWRGEMYRRAGTYDLAHDEFERLEALATESDAVSSEAADRTLALSLTKQGEIEMHQGDLETAESSLARGLELYRELGDVRGEAASQLRLGILAWTRGDFAAAEEQIIRSLESYRELGDKHGESKCLGNLAMIALRTGDLDGAQSHATQSLEVRQALGARLGEADSLLMLGEIALERDAFDTATENVSRGFEIVRGIGAKRTEANSLMLLGEIAGKKGEPAEATEYLDQSLEIWEEIGVDHGKAECLRKLGNISAERQAFGDAEEYLTQSLDVVRNVGDRREEAETLVDLGELACETEDWATARERFELASDIYRDIGAPQEALNSLERLIEVAESVGDRDRAVSHCETALELAASEGLGDHQTTFEHTLDRLSEEPAQ